MTRQARPKTGATSSDPARKTERRRHAYVDEVALRQWPASGSREEREDFEALPRPERPADGAC